MYDTDWSAKWLADLHSNRWAKQVPAYEGVFTFGATEPVMTVLELRGFRMRDFFLMGDNADCGAIITPTESAANNIEVALEPAYRVKVTAREDGTWQAAYDRRLDDGAVPSWFVTDITLKDGTVAMRDGHRVS